MARNLSNRRKYGVRQEKSVIYIYSEGKVTEPMYFRSLKKELRLSEVHIVHVGTGFGTVKLVSHVIKEKSNMVGDYECWAVFDKDSFTDFNQAISLANANDINAAYSNECFEFWYIIHFEYLQTSLGRKNFGAKLSESLGMKYEKNMDVYPLVKEYENTAIANAKRLEKMHDSENTTSYEKRSPSTTVYKLVERLRALA